MSNLILRKHGEDLFSIPASTPQEALTNSLRLCTTHLYNSEVGFYWEHSNVRTNVNKLVEDFIKKRS